MSVQAIESLSQFHQIINSDKPQFIEFWDTGSGACEMMSPRFEKLAQAESSRGAIFWKVNVDEQTDIPQEVGIRAMPTFAVFQNGNKLGDHVGTNINDVASLISEHAR